VGFSRYRADAEPLNGINVHAAAMLAAREAFMPRVGYRPRVPNNWISVFPEKLNSSNQILFAMGSAKR